MASSSSSSSSCNDGGGAKKRRRTGWDAPAAPTLPVPASMAVAVPSFVAAAQPPLPKTPLVTQQQAHAQILLAQQALAQTLAAASSASKPPIPPLPSSSSSLPQPIPSLPMGVGAGLTALSSLPVPIAAQGPQRIECRLYIGSLHYSITEMDIRAMFAGFGAITRVDMSYEPSTGKSKGYCFLEYADPMSVYAALEMNGFEIASRKIKVGRPSGVPGAPLTPQLIADAKVLLGLGTVSVSVPGPGVGDLAATAAPSSTKQPPVKSKHVLVRNIRKDLEISEVESIFAVFGTIKHCVFSVGDDMTVLNPYPITSTGQVCPTLVVRTALVEFATVAVAAECIKTMNGFLLAGQTLLVDTVDEPRAAKILQKSPPPAPAAAATGSRVVLLQNMVPPEEAADPQLKREVGEESQRFGALEDIEVYIDRHKVVVVVLTYAQAESARQAYEAMNGRYFGGRLITARFPQFP